MVDMGATDNFINDHKVRQLELNIKKSLSRMMVIKLNAMQIFKLVNEVLIKIEIWSESINIMVVPLDNFQVILGIEFMHAIKIVPMSFLNSVLDIRRRPLHGPNLKEKLRI